MQVLVKVRNNETPEFLRSLLPKRIGDVRPQSRNPDNYYNVKARTETFRSSFIPSSVKLWNSLDVCDRTLTYVDCLIKKTSHFFCITVSGKAVLSMHSSEWHVVNLILIYFHYMLLTLQCVLAGTFERTRIIIYYNVLCIFKLGIRC